MYIAHILFPIEVLGIGKRIGIWMCGCNHKCKGCSNPELWETNSKYSISVDQLMILIRQIADKNLVHGFTITGGEPFLQNEELCEVVNRITEISADILVYTGFTIQELKEMNNNNINNILDKISVLIDGRYIEEENNNVVLRGSGNQKIHILNDKFEERYTEYIKNTENMIQNFTLSTGVVSVGIHKPGFKYEFEKEIKNYTGIMEE